MEKVGHPSSALFKKARSWYETAKMQREFQSALSEAGALAKGIPQKERLKLNRAFKSANKNYDLSAAKLQAELSTSLRAHFAAIGVTEGSVIKLTYPVYKSTHPQLDVERMAEATIQVKGFAYSPIDETNCEERFRVVAHLVNGQGVIEEKARFFPFDKRCGYVPIP